MGQQHTVIDIEHEKPLSFAERMYDVDMQLVRVFLHFPLVALVVRVRRGSLRVGAEVDIEIIDDVW